MSKEHHTSYDDETTARCERVLVTLIGDIGPWNQRVYLVGGMAPRYLVGSLPEGSLPHVGTTDVDLVIGLAIDDDSDETYRTLETNLKGAGFKAIHSYQWKRSVDDYTVAVEFLCETSEVDHGRIFKPREGAGTNLGAFNVHGAQLVTRDYIECTIEADRLDRGGLSRVTVRVADILSYVVLKILAFQDRHENKDAYDLIYCLANYGEGPGDAGRHSFQSKIASDSLAIDALVLLGERFQSTDHDGPHAYAAFLDDGDDDSKARLRREAVAIVREFLTAFRDASAQ